SNPPISAGLKICSTIIIQAKDYLKNGGILQIVSKHNKGGRRLMELMKKTYGNMEILDKRSGYGVYASVYI
ncbi:MAG: class I SAM-dependent methyltransferase, partial [Thermoprotei archaeon]